MKTGGLRAEIETHIEILEAIYALVHQLKHNSSRLQKIRANWQALPREMKLTLRDELREEVKWARKEVGALASNQEYLDLLKEIRGTPGYVYIPKMTIDAELFDNYARFFPRWPHMRLHAAAIFDGEGDGGTGQVYELEGPWLDDARDFLSRARRAEKGVSDFRKRAKQDQLESLRFARAAILATFNFVEAYLNGLAYDCFHVYHPKLPIEDHDLLAEWDSDKKKRRFVDFREKVFKYPVVVGRQLGSKVDLSGCKAAHQLIEFAKEFRDALVHPSPFIDPKTKEHTKFLIATGANRAIAEQIFKTAVEYAEFVEKALGNEPRLSAPWLFKDLADTKDPEIDQLDGKGAASKDRPR